MAKVSYILVILAGFILFNSCSNQQKIEASAPQPKAPAAARIQKSYGAYLAGRVAHLRKNFNTAADYYIKALNEDPDIRICSVVFMSFLPPKGELPKRRATPKYLCKRR